MVGDFEAFRLILKLVFLLPSLEGFIKLILTKCFHSLLHILVTREDLGGFLEPKEFEVLTLDLIVNFPSLMDSVIEYNR